MHSLAHFHSVDSPNSYFDRYLSLLLPRLKQIAEPVLLFCVFVWTALPTLQLALVVVQTTLPAASPEQLVDLIAPGYIRGESWWCVCFTLIFLLELRHSCASAAASD